MTGPQSGSAALLSASPHIYVGSLLFESHSDAEAAQDQSSD